MPLSVALPGADVGPEVKTPIYREALGQKLSRWVLGLAYACHPKRIRQLPALVVSIIGDVLRGGTVLPPRDRGFHSPNGFSGVALSIAPSNVVDAARRGFFLWSHIGPLKWWTRDQRMVLEVQNLHISKNTRRMLRNTKWRVTVDHAFGEVMKGCAGQRPGRLYGLTWITPRIMKLYAKLHSLGYSHSFEIWNEKGELIGGGYGLAIGRIFVLESMFSRTRDSSKIGLAVFANQLDRWGFAYIDGKDWSASLEDRGFKLISRAAYEAILDEHAQADVNTDSWTLSVKPADVARWQAEVDIATKAAA